MFPVHWLGVFRYTDQLCVSIILIIFEMLALAHQRKRHVYKIDDDIKMTLKFLYLITTGWTIRLFNPGREKRFSVLHNHANQFWGPYNLLFNGWQCSFPGAKWPGREIDHSSPYSAEVKNEWGYTSTPLARRHGVDSKYFNLTLNKEVVGMLSAFWWLRREYNDASVPLKAWSFMSK